jgi:hypothetical protein
MEELLPTITDAIHFVELMGGEYLWVDQLCIAQDDRDEILHTVSAMNRIYNASVFTIVADGRDATCGLAGLRQHSRSFDPVASTVDGIQLTRKEPQLDPLLEESPLRYGTWNTRGWTYQELYLSTRRFIFTGGRVYYSCGMETRIETAPDRHLGPLIDLTWLDHENSDATFLYHYFIHLMHYTARDLTDPNDILNAFQGILSDFSHQFDIPFYFGVPLDKNSVGGLLWVPNGRSGTESSRRRSGFPTWSWASYLGPVCVCNGELGTNCIRFKNEKPTSDLDGRILEFKAKCVMIDPRNFEGHYANCFTYWMGDASPWREKVRECFLLTYSNRWLYNYPSNMTWLIIEEGPDGIYYRCGILCTKGISNKKLKYLLDKRGVKMGIRLG